MYTGGVATASGSDDQCAGGQLGDRRRQVSEAASVVAPVAADQSDAVVVLVGEDAKMRQPSTFSL